MIYKMKKLMYDALRRESRNHDEVIDYVNDMLGLVNKKEQSIVAEDLVSGSKTPIHLERIRAITNIVTD